jgi:hypothetical protein
MIDAPQSQTVIGEDGSPGPYILICDEVGRAGEIDSYEGTIEHRSGRPLYLYWLVERRDEATSECITGTRIRTIIVYEDDDGDLIRYVNGEWMIRPKGNRAHVIYDRLLSVFDGGKEQAPG